MSREDSDRTLWQLAQQGNAAAYAWLRKSHKGLVRSQLQRRCHWLPPSDLDDLEQEVWIAVWTALPRFRGHSAFTTWLVGVTKNVLHGWLRHERSTEETLQRLRDRHIEELPASDANDALNFLSVTEAIDRLSRLEHRVIELRYFHHLADQEIARRLDVPLGTVKGRIRRGLMHLRQSFTGPAEVENAFVAPATRGTRMVL